MNPDDPRKAEWLRAAMDRYAGPLVKYAMVITDDLEQARDVVQDTFIRLCDENPASLDSHMAQWLFTVCRNRALDMQRKEQRMRPLNDVEMNLQASPEPSPATEAERREAVTEAVGLMANLPKNQQEAIRLKFQNGLSYLEISKVMNLTVSNVGFLIHTAIKSLREQMQPKPGAAAAPMRRTI